MKCSPIPCQHPRPRLGLLISSVLAAGLAACGGGGSGSGASAPTAAAPVRSTALSEAKVPAKFDFSTFRSFGPILSRDIAPDAAWFPQPRRSYVSLWHVDAQGQVQQVLFTTLATLQALDLQGGVTLQVPRTVQTLKFEAYDSRGSAYTLTGEIKR